MWGPVNGELARAVRGHVGEGRGSLPSNCKLVAVGRNRCSIGVEAMASLRTCEDGRRQRGNRGSVSDCGVGLPREESGVTNVSSVSEIGNAE